MKTKAVRFNCESSTEIFSLLENFRQMCNDAIRVAVTKKPKSKFELTRQSYPKLFCAVCDKVWDRDVLANLNIMAAPLVRAARSPKCSSEEEPQRQATVSNPVSRRVEGWSSIQVREDKPEP